MLALIDGDVVVYSSAFAAQKHGEIEPVEHALHNAKELVEKVLKTTHSDEVIVYLTNIDAKKNYRYKLSPSYKENRKNFKRPVHYEAVRDYLVTQWNASITEDIEADDALGITQCTSTVPTVLCTIDKDLDMIPGDHYNWKKDIQYSIPLAEANRTFYKQMLIGDPVDNIKGITGIGKVKADRLIQPYYSEERMFDEVSKHYRHQYRQHSPETVTHIILTTANLLWIQREPNILWQPPK